MEEFFPFIHKIEKKKDLEYLPLYIEIEPEYYQETPQEEEPQVIIIDL